MLRDERQSSVSESNFQWIALDQHDGEIVLGQKVLTVARYREVPEVALELRSELCFHSRPGSSSASWLWRETTSACQFRYCCEAFARRPSRHEAGSCSVTLIMSRKRLSVGFELPKMLVNQFPDLAFASVSRAKNSENAFGS